MKVQWLYVAYKVCGLPGRFKALKLTRIWQGLHETTYHCCGQTVDGDGDLGPPAGE